MRDDLLLGVRVDFTPYTRVCGGSISTIGRAVRFVTVCWRTAIHVCWIFWGVDCLFWRLHFLDVEMQHWALGALGADGWLLFCASCSCCSSCLSMFQKSGLPYGRGTAENRRHDPPGRHTHTPRALEHQNRQELFIHPKRRMIGMSNKSSSRA